MKYKTRINYCGSDKLRVNSQRGQLFNYKLPELHHSNSIPLMIADDIIDAVKTFMSKFKRKSE